MKKVTLIALLGLTFASCNNTIGWNIKPSGEVITDTISIKSFQTLLNNSSANIELDSSINENQIIVVGDKSFVENLDIKNNNNQLDISNKKKVSFNTKSSPLIIKMNNPKLQKVIIAGSGSIATNNVTITNDIEFHISGAGEINAKLFNNMTSIYVNGAGDIRLRGESSELKASMSGAGSLNAENLQNKLANIEISGAGSAKVNTSEEINVRISGVGSLDYKKYDQLKISQKISGIGSVDSY